MSRYWQCNQFPAFRCRYIIHFAQGVVTLIVLTTFRIIKKSAAVVVCRNSILKLKKRLPHSAFENYTSKKYTVWDNRALSDTERPKINICFISLEKIDIYAAQNSPQQFKKYIESLLPLIQAFECIGITLKTTLNKLFLII